MRLPSIHLNGTSKRELILQAEDAFKALDNAIIAMAKMTPHPRDYYIQEPGAFDEAIREHVDRVRRLESVKAEIQDFIVALVERD